jgi:hypothetical protein
MCVENLLLSYAPRSRLDYARHGRYNVRRRVVMIPAVLFRSVPLARLIESLAAVGMYVSRLNELSAAGIERRLETIHQWNCAWTKCCSQSSD